ncbi:putative 1-acylglycerol-3-phosphate O-acyltransferase [Helianthus annuus]|uniref:1-acyl-sn-glycerol-3-phosphate acyltransferase n=2 Tax=Helianthus annuus TaxID=4232 RepID=A0A9K3E541_HELAN|nr:1-acyl-sn-glycerol-3-phosphate acyltransferase BAT2, chloroplastic isoform X1 [Helianthus annuus]XP_022012965.1 1-acyl-sn-glycerol-3-phosphate acyltransferase BAT2, chloroplastic isoform X1 [Helianthus annuus]XP_022012966.1 1-acyl-sn-glycerol-3-phosphate acyltransferase BAT2, chloroplastic isoform X1 [Helianthus annuus]XP_022012968.1 1-acyl-sn-glycerol-3-phosphate acyltransferase BAT2, chloroplastic isoform X1 [Helianthus annuus]KAF5766313.1 putative 1-acylglycerol-3-phosphate O-acyltransfer
MAYSSSVQLVLNCYPYKDLVGKCSKNYAIRQCLVFDKRKSPCPPQQILHTDEMFTCKPNHYSKLHNRFNVLRSVVVRSEIAGAGSPAAAYQLPEFQLTSKVRGVCFYAVTSIVAIFLFVLMVIGHPFVLLRDRYQRSFHHLIAKIWASMTVFPFFKIKIEGFENLPPKNSPAVYVANHQSFLDIYALLTLGRNLKFISKTAIFLFPIVGWAMFLMGVIPLKRMDSRSQLQTLKRCMEIVKNGGSVFFFPEGTRSKDGRLGNFKKGAFSIAAKTGVPVVPITLVGTGKIMPAGMEGILNPGSVKIIIHQPVQGDNPDTLCNEAVDVISNELICQG